jgi:hypothetical protein
VIPQLKVASPQSPFYPYFRQTDGFKFNFTRTATAASAVWRPSPFAESHPFIYPGLSGGTCRSVLLSATTHRQWSWWRRDELSVRIGSLRTPCRVLWDYCVGGVDDENSSQPNADNELESCSTTTAACSRKSFHLKCSQSLMFQAIPRNA